MYNNESYPLDKTYYLFRNDLLNMIQQLAESLSKQFIGMINKDEVMKTISNINYKVDDMIKLFNKLLV